MVGEDVVGVVVVDGGPGGIVVRDVVVEEVVVDVGATVGMVVVDDV